MPGTNESLNPFAENPPGAGHRRIVQVSQIEVMEPTDPQQPHTAM